MSEDKELTPEEARKRAEQAAYGPSPLLPLYSAWLASNNLIGYQIPADLLQGAGMSYASQQVALKQFERLLEELGRTMR